MFLSPIRTQALLPNTLTEITRPYLGMYECNQLLMDGESKLDEFEYIKIELKSDGEMYLYFLDKTGKSGQAIAEYTYDEKAQMLTMFKKIGQQTMKRSFPLKNGEILVYLIYETKTITMKFKQI